LKEYNLYSYQNCPFEIKTILDKIIEIFKEILEDNLVGIYLHGSLAMGCFNPRFGDIDFLAVVRDKLSLEHRKEIINSILELSKSKHIPPKGIEFNVILNKDLKQLTYPTPFELHYSIMHRERYTDDPDYICGDDFDPDLAAHITIAFTRGITLYGKPIKQVFHPIPEEYYIRSILYDLEDIQTFIQEDPVDGILNLCRVLYYIKEKIISSKDEAGSWAIENLPERFTELAGKAQSCYRGVKNDMKWNKKELSTFTDYMMDKINEDCPLY